MNTAERVTSAVTRVLREHFDPTGIERDDPYAAAVYAEAAAALAEAGLLRDHATIDALNQRCQILVDEADRLRAQTARDRADLDAAASMRERLEGDVERAVARCRHLHQEGLSRQEWHAKHCGAVEAADAMRAQIDRVRSQLVRMTKSSDEKTQRHGNALLHILDGTGAR